MKMNIKYLNNTNKAKVSILLVCFQIILSAVFLKFEFESNDDEIFVLLLSGSYTGYPSAHLIFINIILAQFFKCFYLLNSSINWYPIFLISFAFSIFIFFNYILFNLYRQNFKIFLFSNLIVYIILLSLFVNMNFSEFAILGVMAGFIPLLLIKTNTFTKILCLFFFLIGSMLRIDMIPFSFIFFSPVIVFNYKLLFKKKLLIVFSTFMMLALFLYIIHITIYNQDPLWADVLKLNLIKSNLTVSDNSRFNINDAKLYLKDVSWSGNDFNLVYNFMWDNGSGIFEFEKMKLMESKINKFSFQSPYSMFLKILDLIKYIFNYFIYNGICLTFVILFLFYILTKNIRYLLKFVFFIIAVLFLLFILQTFTSNNIYKDRIFWSAFLPCLLFSIFTIHSKENIQNSIKFKIFGFIFLAIGIVYFTVSSNFNLSKINIKNANNDFDNLIDQKYINWVGICNSGNIFKSPTNHLNSIFLGWLAGTPHNINKIHELCKCTNINGIWGLKSSCWLFKENDFRRIKMVETYFKEHYEKPQFSYQIVKFQDLKFMKVIIKAY